MIWTVVLIASAGGGTLIAARHWWGWLIATCSEILWAIYAITISATPLLVMSAIWFLINLRNTIVSYRDSKRKSVAAN